MVYLAVSLSLDIQVVSLFLPLQTLCPCHRLAPSLIVLPNPIFLHPVGKKLYHLYCFKGTKIAKVTIAAFYNQLVVIFLSKILGPTKVISIFTWGQITILKDSYGQGGRRRHEKQQREEKVRKSEQGGRRKRSKRCCLLQHTLQQGKTGTVQQKGNS